MCFVAITQGLGTQHRDTIHLLPKLAPFSHSAKAALSRLQRVHGNLVGGVTKIECKTSIKEFFQKSSHLRGQDLSAMEEAVQHYSTETSKSSFDAAGLHYDSDDLVERYATPERQEEWEVVLRPHSGLHLV